MDEKKSGKAPAGIAAELYFWAQALVFALVVLVCINVFFFRISGVVGHSMNPGLSDKDQIVMQVIGYREPKPGHLVVVMSSAFKDEPLVKRVIGVEGDVIDFDMNTGNLIRNGEVLYEPYISERTMKFGSQNYPVTVPEGHMFVMGDNRNHSSDSRDLEVGVLPYKNIVGRVVLRVWPVGKIGAPK